MGAVSGWVLSIVGIIIITVIVEITMPEGNINKYIKGILVLFTVFIMVSPLTKIDVFNVLENGYDMVLDSDFLGDITKQKIEEYETMLADKLSENGYKNVVIDIITQNDETVEIVTIFVDLTKLVLNGNNQNINIYNNIKNIIKSVVEVEAEDIIFNE